MLPADTPVTQLSATDKGSEKLAIQPEETPQRSNPGGKKLEFLWNQEKGKN